MRERERVRDREIENLQIGEQNLHSYCIARKERKKNIDAHTNYSSQNWIIK